MRFCACHTHTLGNLMWHLVQHSQDQLHLLAVPLRRRFEMLPTVRTVLLQMCDLEDETVKGLLQEAADSVAHGSQQAREQGGQMQDRSGFVDLQMLLGQGACHRSDCVLA